MPPEAHDHARRLAAHHERIRRRGVARPVYWVIRGFLQPLIHVWFRPARIGRRHLPGSGPVILAANHRSFLDPFLIAVCVRRPIYFFAKQELFERRVQGLILNALGAFPVRRGESDEEALETARAVLSRGDPLVVFPEGTRTRSGSLSRPRRGVGRLALETGAPVVPIAVNGSEHVRRGWRIRPCKVRLRLGRPLRFPRIESPSPRLAAAVTRRIWPCVQLQWEWLGGLPPLRRAAVVGAGPMGTALATVLARAGVEVELGCRAQPQADSLASELPGGVRPAPVQRMDLEGADLVALAVPSRSLQATMADVGDRIGQRSDVLVLSKGLVAPLGATPTAYVSRRSRARAVGWLGGPAHAGELAAVGASVVLAARDDGLSQRVGSALDAAGLDVDLTKDVEGAELAGCAKNVAALAAAAAAPAGMNAAGAAAGRVFAEVHSLARHRGTGEDSFAGLAGAGDLVATALAPGSRNRRAGELLSRGVPAERIPAMIGGTPEALDAAPLLAAVLEREDAPCAAAACLAALVEGRLSPEEWLHEVRSGHRHARRRAA